MKSIKVNRTTVMPTSTPKAPLPSRHTFTQPEQAAEQKRDSHVGIRLDQLTICERSDPTPRSHVAARTQPKEHTGRAQAGGTRLAATDLGIHRSRVEPVLWRTSPSAIQRFAYNTGTENGPIPNRKEPPTPGLFAGVENKTSILAEKLKNTKRPALKKESVRRLVLHSTSSEQPRDKKDKTISDWKSTSADAHYLITTGGAVKLAIPIDTKANHVGTDGERRPYNSTSIGIEHEQKSTTIRGKSKEEIKKKFRQLDLAPGFRKRLEAPSVLDKLIKKKGSEYVLTIYEDITPEQKRASFLLAKELSAYYPNLDMDKIGDADTGSMVRQGRSAVKNGDYYQTTDEALESPAVAHEFLVPKMLGEGENINWFMQAIFAYDNKVAELMRRLMNFQHEQERLQFEQEKRRVRQDNTRVAQPVIPPGATNNTPEPTLIETMTAKLMRHYGYLMLLHEDSLAAQPSDELMKFFEDFWRIQEDLESDLAALADYK